MGTKKTKSKKSSLTSRAVSVGKQLLGGRSKGGKRRSRVTPEKLAKQILILKLKKKLFRMKYGGK